MSGAFSWGAAAPAAKEPLAKEAEADATKAPRLPGLQANSDEDDDEDEDDDAATRGADGTSRPTI